MEIVVTEKPTKEDISEIREAIRDYNSSYLEGIKYNDVVCYLNGANGRKIAGIIGCIKGKWLSVEYLWVSESQKGNGLGSQLLTRLEILAKEKGCHSAMLHTASFQAEPFYKKHGYKTKMILDDFTDDTEVYYMIKKFDS